MSHFAVMVIGDNHKAQLQPFHEFECTGYDDEYVEDTDITDEVLAHFERFAEEGKENPLQEALEWHGLENQVVEDSSQLDLSGTHKYRYAIVQDGQLVKVVERTNPNAKWDWYQVGGRWTGFLKLKPGAEGEIGEPGLMTPEAKDGWADCARKGDVDWDGMRSEAEKEAAEHYDKMRSLAPDDWTPWETIRDQSESIDKAREVYRAQPQVNAIREEDCWCNVDSFLEERGRYIELAGKSAVATFAILRDGEWIERGEMGWWAIISNDVGKENWMDKAWEIIQSLSDDELITVVDCHI
jgi:hypothetical protein